MSNLLALDLGTECGWAMNYPKLMGGVWDLQPTRYESSGIRFLKFKKHLEVEITIGAVEMVVYEEVHHHVNITAAHIYGGWLSSLQTICLEYDIPYRGVGVQTIHKHALGKGQSPKGKKKELMLEAAIKKFKNVNVIDHNHADALWLLDYSLCNLISQ